MTNDICDLYSKTVAAWPLTLAPPTLTCVFPVVTVGRSTSHPGHARSPPTSRASITRGRCCVSRASRKVSITGSWRCPNRGPTWAWRTPTSHAKRRANAAWWAWTSCRGACSLTNINWALGMPDARSPSQVSCSWTRGRCASECCWTTRPERSPTTRDRCVCTPSTAHSHRSCLQRAGSGKVSLLRSANPEHLWSFVTPNQIEEVLFLDEPFVFLSRAEICLGRITQMLHCYNLFGSLVNTYICMSSSREIIVCCISLKMCKAICTFIIGPYDHTDAR